MTLDQVVILAQVAPKALTSQDAKELASFVSETHESSQAASKALQAEFDTLVKEVKLALLVSNGNDDQALIDSFATQVNEIAIKGDRLREANERLRALVKVVEYHHRMPYVGFAGGPNTKLKASYLRYCLANDMMVRPAPTQGHSSLAGDAKWEFIGT